MQKWKEKKHFMQVDEEIQRRKDRKEELETLRKERQKLQDIMQGSNKIEDGGGLDLYYNNI
jgi:RNA polymerase-binding transcription factor DksA